MILELVLKALKHLQTVVVQGMHPCSSHLCTVFFSSDNMCRFPIEETKGSAKPDCYESDEDKLKWSYRIMITCVLFSSVVMCCVYLIGYGGPRNLSDSMITAAVTPVF